MNYYANQRRGKKRPRRRDRPSCRPSVDGQLASEGQVPAPEAPDSADALPDNHKTKKTRKRSRSGASRNRSVREHDLPQAYSYKAHPYPYRYQPFAYPPGIVNRSNSASSSFFPSAPWANPQSMYGHCDMQLYNLLPSDLVDVLNFPSSGRNFYMI